METKLILMMAALFALCGCGQQARIDGLEKRVKFLEEQRELARLDWDTFLTNDTASTSRLRQMMLAISNNQSVAWMGIRAASQQQESLIKSEVERQVAERFAAQQKPGLRAALPAPVRAPEMRDGVPLPIYNQIAADAAKEWSGDFTMQAWQIKQQTEAYRKLH